MRKWMLVIGMMGITWMAKAQQIQLSGQVLDEKHEPLSGAEVFVEQSSTRATTDANGHYRLQWNGGDGTLVFFAIGYKTEGVTFSGTRDTVINKRMKPLEETLEEVVAKTKRDPSFQVGHLHGVEGASIYEGKKSEVILPSELNANTATNNARQVFSSVPGLNIWESDAAGLQLGIGGRGLNPNRTSNFNTRQNGYDISADPLGYPESYYTPPMEGVEKIELVRGAASLQYGTQFGGMLNFVIKDGPEDKKIAFHTRNTLGSFGLFTSFNSLGGKVGKLQYYTFYEHKLGNGWRENTQFASDNVYAHTAIDLSKSWTLAFDFTHMNYLAQQPGGLTDRMFDQDPQQSVRGRNWFQVQWNIPAMTLTYQPSSLTRVEGKVYGLVASRGAVGNLNKVTEADITTQNRNLLLDHYRNVGAEVRLLQRYHWGDQLHALAAGVRYFHGNTHKQQGEANAEAGPSFKFLHPEKLENSDFRFPSQNVAAFAENIFSLNDHWSVTPGIRYEHIVTGGDGYYRLQNQDQAGNIIYDSTIYDHIRRVRDFALLGIGVSYKSEADFELYANFSQNYRAITFNDLRVSNPNLKVDENLKDENGFNADIGVRGKWKEIFSYDASLFYLKYNQRIGSVWRQEKDPVNGDKSYRYRTNVADANIVGVEAYGEWSIAATYFKEKSPWKLSWFHNISFIKGRYVNAESSAIEGNVVEWVPPINYKTGLRMGWKDFSATLQYAYVAKEYSEATNADYVPSGVDGAIPAYYVADLSMSYTRKHWKLNGGINNLSNNIYFTRRATGYPGPGIIPAEPRNFYVSVELNF